MVGISEIKTIREFKNDGVVYGVYLVVFNGKQEVFVRNSDSVGAIQHWVGEPANKCINEIRGDVKQKFLQALEG